tara:strand:+ start:194 stop:358 length:165 start_codon:yes stop_codon:yes gene_type:complete
MVLESVLGVMVLYQWDDAYSIYEILKRNNLKIEDNTDVLLKGLVSKETYSIKVD